MNFLTKEQLSSFAATNALVGLGPNEYTAELSPEEEANLPKVRRMAHDPKVSHYPPHIVSVGSIDEMRKIAGYPPVGEVEKTLELAASGTGNDEPHYPDPPTKADMMLILKPQKAAKPEITEELKGRIRQAAHAYVMGNPHKVKAYVPLINAAFFPSQLAVFTGAVLNVPAGTTHQIVKDPTHAGPVLLNYGKITVGQGGTIEVEADVNVTTQLFIQD